MSEQADRQNTPGKEEERSRNPRPAADQDSPEPERSETIQEAEGVSPNRRQDPPQAEGDRDEPER